MNNPVLNKPPFWVRSKGFTLLELVIAVTIFSIISTASYYFITQVLIANDRSESIAQQLVEIQKTMMLLQQDLEQVVPRSVRDTFGSPQSALMTDAQGLIFTRVGWPILPFGRAPRSEVLRAQYWLDDDRLMRRYWPIPDQSDDPVFREMVLLEQVNAFEVRFLYEDEQKAMVWTDSWPVSATDIEEGAVSTLPVAIELTLDVPRYGELRRLFRVVANEPINS